MRWGGGGRRGGGGQGGRQGGEVTRTGRVGNRLCEIVHGGRRVRGRHDERSGRVKDTGDGEEERRGRDGRVNRGDLVVNNGRTVGQKTSGRRDGSPRRRRRRRPSALATSMESGCIFRATRRVFVFPVTRSSFRICTTHRLVRLDDQAPTCSHRIANSPCTLAKRHQGAKGGQLCSDSRLRVPPP